MTKEDIIILLDKMINESYENRDYYEKLENFEIASFNAGVIFGCKYAKVLLSKELKER